MTIKRMVFWAHLGVGVTAGLIILVLSITGVLLTYERQIVALLEQRTASVAGQERLSADVLLRHGMDVSGGKASGVVFAKDARAPVVVQIGRGQSQLLDPYTAEPLEGAVATRAFFHWVTVFHRWFALDGASRDVARAITGAANLAFLFIVVSGLYLWLPKRWRWPLLKMNLFFRRRLPSAQARDYNWHHVIGFWCLVPLFVIVITGAVFSYGWANTLVYSVYGEEAPRRGGPPGSMAVPQSTLTAPASVLDFQTLLEKAETFNGAWQRITLQPAAASAPSASFVVDTGSGAQPQRQTTLTLNRVDGEVLKVSGFTDRSPGQQTRIFIRFLHTGEALGLAGQTVAGLASLGACFLVYTGLMLAYRRLVQPILIRRRRRERAA